MPQSRSEARSRAKPGDAAAAKTRQRETYSQGTEKGAAILSEGLTNLAGALVSTSRVLEKDLV